MSSKAGVRRGAYRLFDPYTAQRSQLKCWLSAQDIGTGRVTDEATRVISHVDRIGGLDFTATTGTSARPTAGNTSFIGADGSTYKGISCDGAANTLVGATTGLPLTSTPSMIIALATGPLVADGANRNLFTYGGTAGGAFKRIRKATTDNASVSDGTISANALGSSASWIGVPKIIVGIFDATTVDIRANGNVGSSGTGAALNTGSTRSRIAADTANTAANFWLGVYAEIFVLTLGNTLLRQQIEGYLAWFYGCVSLLPPTHPYKNTRP